MFQLSHHTQFMPVLASLLLTCSCSHSNPDIKGGNSNPVRVKVMTADRSASEPGSNSYSGTVEAGSSTTPSFSVAGTITKINVTEGQRITKGQLIATIDGASLHNSYDIAQATLHEVRDAYDRMKKLHDANALPDMQWVAVQQKLKQAEAAAAIARTGMNDASLYAPISGIVARKLADVGQNIAPGIPVVEIMDIAILKVKITVPESDLADLHVGTDAAITAGSQTYAGTLVEKGIAANTLSRNYDVKFRINNPDGKLLPGMLCNVSVESQPSSGSATPSAEIILPPQAVVLNWNNSSYVWIAKNGTAQRQKVDMGGLDSRGIIITGGITPTDSVIVEGQQKLSQGLKVVTVN